jgi:hypothetical protein
MFMVKLGCTQQTHYAVSGMVDQQPNRGEN